MQIWSSLSYPYPYTFTFIPPHFLSHHPLYPLLSSPIHSSFSCTCMAYPCIYSTFSWRLLSHPCILHATIVPIPIFHQPRHSHLQTHSHTSFSIYTLMQGNSLFPTTSHSISFSSFLMDFEGFRKCQCLHALVVKLVRTMIFTYWNSLPNEYASWGYMGLCMRICDEIPMEILCFGLCWLPGADVLMGLGNSLIPSRLSHLLRGMIPALLNTLGLAREATGQVLFIMKKLSQFC